MNDEYLCHSDLIIILKPVERTAKLFSDFEMISKKKKKRTCKRCVVISDVLSICDIPDINRVVISTELNDH